MAEPQWEVEALAPNEVRAVAPAKINLYLHVTGRRDDGYHLLDSLIVFVDATDIVTVSPAEELILEVDGPFARGVPGDSRNLVVQAARVLADWGGVVPKARIRLTKRLPAASGVGGGSADAAATLRCLSRLWDVRPGAREMADLALELGADVPVCLAGFPSYIGGIGEDILVAPHLPRLSIVLANPGVAVSTPEVFAKRAGPFSQPARFDEPPADAAELASWLMERNNDLMVPATSLAPAIGAVLVELADDKDCLLARMSGSGATCFGLFAETGAARRVAAHIRATYPDWWATSAEVLTGPTEIEAGPEVSRHLAAPGEYA